MLKHNSSHSTLKNVKKASSTEYLDRFQLDSLVRNDGGPGCGKALSRTMPVLSLISIFSVTLLHLSHRTEIINLEPYTSITGHF